MSKLHVVMIAAGALAGGIPQAEGYLPESARPYAHALIGLCAVVAVVCGALSEKMGADK